MSNATLETETRRISVQGLQGVQGVQSVQGDVSFVQFSPDKNSVNELFSCILTKESSPCPLPQEPSPWYLRIAGIARESIVDGPGLRLTVFTQGCKHHCPGCHNPQTHDFNSGEMVTMESILEQIRKNPLLDGITLSGGEPFEQAEACSKLARAVHGMRLNVMTYSGYTFEELFAGRADRPGWKELLEETDILVDGRFELSRKSLMLKFRGSENQRILDVKKSLTEGIAVIKKI